MKYYLFIITLLLSSILLGQEEGPVYVSNNFNGDGILLRWAAPGLYFTEGVVIYRKEEGDKGEWLKVTDLPVLPPQISPNNIKVSKASKDFLAYYKKTSKDKFLGDFYGIFAIIQSIKDYQMAIAMGIGYIDVTAKKGKKYEYKIAAIINGKESLIGITEIIKTTDYKPSPALQDIVLKRKKGAMLLKWKYDLLHHYGVFIYRKKDDEKEFKLITKQEIGVGDIKESDKFYYKDSKISNDSAYTYKIQAMDYFGQLTEISKEISKKVEDLNGPQIPVFNLKAKSKEQDVIVSWGVALDDDVKEYNVYRSFEADSNFIKINITPINDTLFLDHVGKSSSVYYKVEAVDKADNSSIGSAKVVRLYDIISPDPPQGLIIKSDTGLMIMSWIPNTEKDLKGYRIMRKIAGDKKSSPMIVNKKLLDTNFYAQKISKNVTAKFIYYVVAVDNKLNISLPSGTAEGKLPDVTPPAAPFLKKSFPLDSIIIINWQQSLEKDLKGYNLYRKKVEDTTGFEQLNYSLIPKNITRYKDARIERGINYAYKLIAVDSENHFSELSNKVSALLPLLPLGGEIKIEKYKYNTNKNTVTFTWSSKLKNEILLGYIVYSSINGGKFLPLSKINKDLFFKYKTEKSSTYQIRAYGVRGNYIQSEEIGKEINK